MLPSRTHAEQVLVDDQSLQLLVCGVVVAEELGAVGATISGAGPTVLFWCHWEQTGNLVERLRSEAADCAVRRVTFSPGGADVRVL